MTDAVRHFEEVYRFDPDPWRFGERGAELHRHAFIAEMAARLPHGRILEIGCSAGALTARLARLGGYLVAFDLSAVPMARARESVGDGATRAETGSWSAPAFLRASAAALPFRPGSFDLVIAADGPLEWRFEPELRREVYHRLHAALAPGGHVLITEYMRPRRFSGFLAEVGATPLRIVEVRYLYDRPWYAFERVFGRLRRYRVVRRILGSSTLARRLDRVGSVFGARAASHVMILAARE